MANDTLVLLEMEDKLVADADGSYRDEICSRLNDCAAEVRQRLDAGLATDEFAQASKLNDAFTAAEETVVERWQAHACSAPRM